MVLKLLLEHNTNRTEPSTELPVSTKQPNHNTLNTEELDSWLNEIIELAGEPEILQAAIESYGVSTTPMKLESYHRVRTKSRRKYQYSNNGVIPDTHPTLHLKGTYAKMAFKRVSKVNNENDNTTASQMEDPLDGGYNQTVDFGSQETTQATQQFIDHSLDNIHELVLDKALEEDVERKVLEYLIYNMTLNVETPDEIQPEANRSFIEKIMETKLSANWLIIGVCVTFSVTCLCALVIGVMVACGNRKKFSPNEWWNGKGDNSEEAIWLGSRSDIDLELGENSAFKELYSLQGAELKKGVSKVVHDFGSSSTSTSGYTMR